MENQMTWNVLDGNSTSEDSIRCYRTELQEVVNAPPLDLFKGFNEIKIITYSYGLGFINEILENFEYAEILLGADFKVEKDTKLQAILAAAEINEKMAHKFPNITTMWEGEDLKIRSSMFLDHRKLFLLKADDGETRVITPTANLSKDAWNGNHIESFQYDDSRFCYDEYIKDFETAWENAREIPYEVEIKEDNHIIREVKETGEAIILQTPQGEDTINKIKYVIEMNEAVKKYKELLKGNKSTIKDERTEISPETIKIIEKNRKRKSRATIKTEEKKYPTLTFDYERGQALLDNTVLDLSPSKEDICHDIDVLLDAFDKINLFEGNIDKIRRIHYKILNALFASPFCAELRCMAFISNKAGEIFPLYLIVNSKKSNCGKTFIMQLILKMMTGMEEPTVHNSGEGEYGVNWLRGVQLDIKGTPVFVDEIDGKYLGHIKALLKNPQVCENTNNCTHPLIAFASNEIPDLEESIRKRVLYFKITGGGLSSDKDKIKLKQNGLNIINSIGTAFYREYLKRMLPLIKEELDKMYRQSSDSDKYFDLMNASSKTLISIFKDFGYNIPDYIRELTWKADYSENIMDNVEDIYKEIINKYNKNKKDFIIDKERITIIAGNDNETKKKYSSWGNILPPELDVLYEAKKDETRVSFDRGKLEEKTGVKFKNRLFNKR